MKETGIDKAEIKEDIALKRAIAEAERTSEVARDEIFQILAG